MLLRGRLLLGKPPHISSDILYTKFSRVEEASHMLLQARLPAGFYRRNNLIRIPKTKITFSIRPPILISSSNTKCLKGSPYNTSRIMRLWQEWNNRVREYYDKETPGVYICTHVYIHTTCTHPPYQTISMLDLLRRTRRRRSSSTTRIYFLCSEGLSGRGLQLCTYAKPSFNSWINAPLLCFKLFFFFYYSKSKSSSAVGA